MKYSAILDSFGVTIREENLNSLYDYAPVYRFNYGDRNYVLKRTGVRSQGKAIADWTSYLVSQGIKSVAPVKEFGQNPRQFFNQKNNTKENWVIYPFIEGIPYTGNNTQILAAGKLLGRIHTAGMENLFQLKVNKTVVAIEAKKIESEIKVVLQISEKYTLDKLEIAREILTSHARNYLKDILPKLLKIDLPLTNCSWDYKAANLIYQTDSDPVLIDPDHGGRIPRTYDLATALLLFHCDLPSAPKRVFTTKEWTVFLTGYKQYIQPTIEDIKTWQDLLLCAWIDQALWLLSHFPEGWENPDESIYLMDLLTIDLSNFSLSS